MRIDWRNECLHPNLDANLTDEISSDFLNTYYLAAWDQSAIVKMIGYDVNFQSQFFLFLL